MATSGTDELDTVDIMAVFDHLPHRYPFLLIDKVIGIDGNRAGIGIKNVTINEPHFQGHFPDGPIMPGVLMIEGMAQTACVICVHHAGRGGNLPKVYFMSIDKARFRRPVVPGDQLEYHVEMLRVRGQVWKFACQARVDGERVAEAVITAMIADA